MPLSSNATSVKIVTASPSTDSTEDAKKISQMMIRLSEIQNMDKTTLTAADKKALKKELREMKATADGLNQRVYLSVGAIIIIILLLILIL